jgi:hypothetical protein
MNEPAQPSLPPGWSKSEPERLPEPTQWPAALALAVTLFFWGLVSSIIISAIGLGLFGWSITGWIRDICHERRHEQ